jgi:hypothetical protein
VLAETEKTVQYGLPHVNGDTAIFPNAVSKPLQTIGIRSA